MPGKSKQERSGGRLQLSRKRRRNIAGRKRSSQGSNQMDYLCGKRKKDKGPYDALVDELVGVDINRMTPVGALIRLDELAREARKARKNAGLDNG